MLQTSKDASNLSQSVVGKMLPFVRLVFLCRRPINQHFFDPKHLPLQDFPVNVMSVVKQLSFRSARRF